MMKNNKGAWSIEEDNLLLSAMDEVTKEIGHVKWCLVAKRLPSRSPKQCRERFVYNLDPKISKAPWTIEEDAFLLFSQKHLGNAWARIASCLPGRTENSTKTRFKSIMRAQKRIWKKHEDEYILSQYEVVGSQWDVIAQGLAGRTKNAVKTRFFFLTEGVGSSRAREGASSSHASSDDDEDDDDTCSGSESSSKNVGNPSQALGLNDTELAQISAKLSQKLSNSVSFDVHSAANINQETVKAAMAQSPKASATSNKRERPVVLQKTTSKSSMNGDKYVLETPKNTIIQTKVEMSPPFSFSRATVESDANDRVLKRQKVELKDEFSFSSSSQTAPIIFQQSQLLSQPRVSMIDTNFDFFQLPNDFQDSLIGNQQPLQHYASAPAAKLTTGRPSFIDFIGTFDYSMNNFGAAHDDGFGINLAEIEPLAWNQ